jgi:hypothetical protein
MECSLICPLRKEHQHSRPCLSVCRVFHDVTTVTLDHVDAMTFDHVVATVALDTIVTFDIMFAFFIPLVALLTSSPVMWRKEHLWNFSVLQREHPSNLALLL